MITKMKKLVFLAYHKEYVSFLDSLRELGVIHIVEKKKDALDEVDIQDDIKLASQLTAAIKTLEHTKLPAKAIVVKDGGSADKGLELLTQIEEIQAENAKLQQHIQSYAKDEAALQVWGDFSLDNLEKLSQGG